jgi:hypothetical protein
VIFNAVFEVGSEKNATMIKLCYNGVRKACRSAKLGYVSRSALSRGISLATIAEGSVLTV